MKNKKYLLFFILCFVCFNGRAQDYNYNDFLKELSSKIESQNKANDELSKYIINIIDTTSFNNLKYELVFLLSSVNSKISYSYLLEHIDQRIDVESGSESVIIGLRAFGIALESIENRWSLIPLMFEILKNQEISELKAKRFAGLFYERIFYGDKTVPKKIFEKEISFLEEHPNHFRGDKNLYIKNINMLLKYLSE